MNTDLTAEDYAEIIQALTETNGRLQVANLELQVRLRKAKAAAPQGAETTGEATS